MDQSAIQLLRQLRPDYANASDEQIEQALTYTTENGYKEGEFLKGIRRATGSTAGGIQALAGQIAEPVTPEWGRNQIESGLRRAQRAQMENPAAVNEFTDIESVGGAVDWAAGSLGEAVPTVATAAVGGGLGSLGLAYARKKLLNEALETALASGAARFAGSTVGLVPQEAGETALSLNADKEALANTTPGERIALSLGKGTVNAALESVVPHVMFGRFAKPTMSASGKLLPAVAKDVGVGVAGEFGTEAAQQFTGDVAQHIANPNHDWLDPKGLLNAGMAGAVSGGAMGGGGAVLSGAGRLMKNGDAKDSTPVMDKIFEAGRNKAKREFAAMDEINNMEAERQGLTPEELILQRAGLSGNVTADDLMVDDQQRTAAASSLATKIVNDVAAPEALRKSAAEFITRAQTDPQAHVDFTNALQSHRDAGGAMQSVNELMDAMGITLPPERRTKNNAQTPEGSAQPRNAREMAQKTAQLWMQKYGAMTDAFSKLDTNNPEAVNAVEGIFNWVKTGMPAFDQVAPRLVRVLGRDAAKHVKTINDYMIAEGLAERTSDAKLSETLAKMQTLINRGVGRFDKLGNLVMPSQQDNLTTRDLKSIDRALNKFAEARNLGAKDVKAFRERMAEYFGGNVDEVLDLYDREVKEDLFNESQETERNEDGDNESVENDWNSGLTEQQNEVTYHGFGDNAGFDTVHDRATNALKSKLAELGNAGFELGAWEKLKRELGESPDALRAQEDELIKKYGDHPSIKSQGSRLGKLRAINKRIRYAGEWTSNEKDSTDLSKRDVKDLEDKTKQGKKTDPEYQTVKHGRLVMERMVDDESNVTGTDPETGEMTFGKKAEEFVVKASRFVKRMRKSRDRGDLQDTNDVDLANTWNQLMAGITSLMNSGEFSGRIGYRKEVNGPVTWLKAGLPSDKEIDAMAEGKKISRKIRVAETGEIITLKDQDAAATIKELRKDIEALEALKICMGA
jgi:hypothetical protein